MARLSVPFRVYLGLVLFSVAGSALSRALRLDPGPIAPVASALTLLAGAWTAVRTCRPLRRPLAAAAFGVVSELAGLATGFPFGRYEYTSRWQPAVFLGPLGWFPLLLPIAWLMVAGAAERVCRPFPLLPRVLAAGVLAAGVDLLMEPAATGGLGYWRWLHPEGLPGGAGPMNVFGWFAVSAIGAALLARSDPPDPPARREAAAVLALHLAMLAAVAALAPR